MPDFTDLEIHILPREEPGYPVRLRLGNSQEFPPGYLPADVLSWGTSGNPDDDGRQLFKMLLSDPPVRDGWNRAAGQSRYRRIRLWIDSGAPELHTLPWELLQENGAPLSASGATPFSRYLPLDLPWDGGAAESPLRVLVAIANPADLDVYNLPALDVAAERAIWGAVGGSTIQPVFLEPPVTLARLEAELRRGYRAVHWVAHGVFSERRKEAALYLEDDSGQVQVASDAAISGMLARLGTPPALIFLAACQSAARASGDAFRGLAPRLIQAGIPAVVAMQSAVAVQAAQSLGSTFYERLAAHGLVDLALNEARSSLITQNQADVSAPVLLMRLRDGRLFQGGRGPDTPGAHPAVAASWGPPAGGSGNAPASVDIAVLRRELQRLDDVELESLCLDRFPTVYDKFSEGMRHDEKVNLLLAHCRRNPGDAARLAEQLGTR